MLQFFTAVGMATVAVFFLVLVVIAIVELNRYRRCKKTKKRMNEIWEAQRKAEEAELDQAGEALLTYVKSHLEFLDNQWINKN